MTGTIHEIGCGDDAALQRTYDILKTGDLIVLRQVPEVLWFRERVLESMALRESPAVAEDLAGLFERRSIASLETIGTYVKIIRDVYHTHILSALLADLIGRLNLPGPQVWGGGIHRMLFPPEVVDAARSCHGLFDKTDFQRARPSSLHEAFTPGWAPPHRDIARPHLTFMMNFWFPLMDLTEEECLVTFPDAYYEAVPIKPEDSPWWKTFGNTPIDQWGYGPPQRTKLNFGDVLLFHSDTVHCSPHVGPETIRLSYDYRVAVHCPDDNGTYREHFHCAENFDGPFGTRNGGYETAQHRADTLFSQVESNKKDWPTFEGFESSRIAQNYQYYLWQTVERASGNLGKAARRTLDCYYRFPFAADRYLNLAQMCGNSNLQIAAEAVDAAIEMTDNYFWSTRAGDLAHMLGDDGMALKAYEKARVLADESSAYPRDNPINFETVPSEAAFPGRLQSYPYEFSSVLNNTIQKIHGGQHYPSEESVISKLMPTTYGLWGAYPKTVRENDQLRTNPFISSPAT